MAPSSLADSQEPLRFAPVAEACSATGPGDPEEGLQGQLSHLEPPPATESAGALDRDLAAEEELRRRSAELAAAVERYRSTPAESALWQGELFRALAEALPPMIWCTDASGRVEYVNSRWKSYTGLPVDPDQLSGWPQVLHPEDQAATAARWAEALRSEGEYVAEYRLRRKDGMHRWFLARGYPLRDASGTVMGWFGTCTDIHDLKEAEQELREADQRKNDFLAVLSHELRNPLAPIRNSLYILQNAAPGSEQASQARAVIDRQVSQLTRLIDDLLDVTRISHGKVQLQWEPVELRELVRRAIEDHRPAFSLNGITLQVSLGQGALWVEGDRTRLAQVVGNLLLNAVKFTPRGGSAAVLVGGDPDGGAATIDVRDDGAGIPPDVLPRLFEPFTQADQTLERSQGGLGLGLALVKGLVQLHQGSVEARSEGPGKGARFTVRLPLAPGGLPGLSAPAPSAPPGRRLKVLVIEDNPDAADTLRQVLEHEKHEVSVATSGPEGLEKARALAPEVVLCDIGLPGMDGYQVARQIRADPELRATYLVALTGYALPDDLARAAQAGFDHHVAKPSTIDTLQRILARVPPRARRTRPDGP